MRTTFLALLTLVGCATSTHPTQPADLGTPRAMADLLAVIDEPGPIEVDTVASADWAVPLSGLLNLEHPKAEAAGLEDHDEPIQIFFHALTHPTRGTFVVDTGAQRALRDDPDHALLTGFVASAMNVEALKVHVALGDWLATHHLDGVLLTHLHVDHILGLPDVAPGTPIYAGPGETAPRAFMNMFSQGITDDALAGHQAIREWRYTDEHRVIDVFGDGSLWALWVPGHTPGSTAYLARTPRGPVLMVGDACHTAWGWQHHVEPGTFSHDQEASKASLEALEALVAAHPRIDVRLGHQTLTSSVAPR